MTEFPLVLDTGVLIALAAATGSWEVLETLERPVVVTPAVVNELRNGPAGSPGTAISFPSCVSVWEGMFEIAPWLVGVLGKGEASVIALALERRWPEVGIDEAVGRSVARTSRLRLTGSLGILIRAKRKGYAVTLAGAIARMRVAGIWIGPEVEREALRVADEDPGS